MHPLGFFGGHPVRISLLPPKNFVVISALGKFNTAVMLVLNVSNALSASLV